LDGEGGGVIGLLLSRDQKVGKTKGQGRPMGEGFRK